MDRIVVCAYSVSPYLNTAFQNGKTPLEYTVARVTALQELDGFDSPPILLTAGLSREELARAAEFDLPPDWERADVPSGDAGEVYDRVYQLVGEAEHTLWTRVDAPFTDFTLARRLVGLHRTNWCDYTFADGYPQGYSVEVMRRDILPVLKGLATAVQQKWEPGMLFTTLQRDINAFDIETEPSPEDYTLFRASLTVDTRQNYLLCRRLVERGDEPEEILKTLLEKPALRRTLPHYYQIQITTEMNQTPSYQPWSRSQWAADAPGKGIPMTPSTWKTVLDRIGAETPEATISLGYRGEPALHPELPKIIDVAAEYPGINLYVETAGIGWQANRDALLKEVVKAVIVELDSVKPETYQKLRNGTRDAMQEATEFVEWLAAKAPGKVYVQATRMNENEWELQEFYRHWSGRNGVTVIIQKYNSFAGLLEDRKVADLTPLNRMPCRHLERDMVVLVDGSVPRCFQDIDREFIRGSLTESTVEDLWSRGIPDFMAHVSQDYPEMCARCDEYYTFNA